MQSHLRRQVPVSFSSANNHELCTETLKPDGSWSDLDYADTAGGHWSPAQHLQRLFRLAQAYTSRDHLLKSDPALGKTIHSALGYWLTHDYHSGNWWHNQIGIPLHIGQVMLLMEGELSPRERKGGLEILARSEIGMTGQNRVWLAGNVFMRGLLENDEFLVSRARDAILGEISENTGEGIQPDSSFHQHGPQLQFGTYGLSFASNCASWAEILHGTDRKLDEARMEVLRKYLLEGLRYVCWKGRMDLSSCGRQLWPGSSASKCASYIEILRTMQRADAEMDWQYECAIESSIDKPGHDPRLPRNKYFWRSDYMVDRRSSYYASVRMSSRRVIGTEEINHENLQGFHLGDGTLFIYQRGDEYEDILPAMDWRKLPGVTAAQIKEPLPIARIAFSEESVSAEMMNESGFVGGASDGHNGVAVLDYRRCGVEAKKSWFFFEGQIVCLGAGISSERDVPIVTCLNQTALRSDVILGQDDALPTRAMGRKEYPALTWAWHDNLGYVFPSPTKVVSGGETQRGAWKSIYRAGGDALLEKDIFAMWIDHGVNPHNASYCYMILPATTAAQVQAYWLRPEVQVCSNTAELQAVAGGNLLMAVFHRPGKLRYGPGKQVQVDQACLIMIEELAHGPKLTLADPTQMLQGLRVILHGKSIAVKFPQGPNAGQSIVLAPPPAPVLGDRPSGKTSS